MYEIYKCSSCSKISLVDYCENCSKAIDSKPLIKEPIVLKKENNELSIYIIKELLKE